MFMWNPESNRRDKVEKIMLHKPHHEILLYNGLVFKKFFENCYIVIPYTSSTWNL